ncbi:TetR family transcriptional regulator C-terminal domain-containing protein [Kitasatospora sp. NPDC092039]|uniref:TetR family transcriptional regulator C-terminal domain-containing protein n=1 Tax=Kitasatospora sp. NPDC092039 TaxID=3364086 RepID=UPI003815A1FB
MPTTVVTNPGFDNQSYRGLGPAGSRPAARARTGRPRRPPGNRPPGHPPGSPPRSTAGPAGRPGPRRRLLDPAPGADRRELTTRLLAETLPLDAERREESALWLSFVTAARTRPELRPRAAQLQAGLDDLVRRVLVESERSGGLAPGLDLDVETRRLSALLDGLTLQAVQHPGLVGPDELRAALRRHLDTLAARAC